MKAGPILTGRDLQSMDEASQGKRDPHDNHRYYILLSGLLLCKIWASDNKTIFSLLRHGLCSSSWPWTHNAPASASVLGLRHILPDFKQIYVHSSFVLTLSLESCCRCLFSLCEDVTCWLAWERGEWSIARQERLWICEKEEEEKSRCENYTSEKPMSQEGNRAYRKKGKVKTHMVKHRLREEC